MTGRPHSSPSIPSLLEKGYVNSLQQAFDDYLDQSAKGYVNRDEPQFADAVSRIRHAGGIASLAHPIRVKGDITAMVPGLCAAGLNAIEAYHSDHSSEDTQSYLELARRYEMLVTGGSDFHGLAKPTVQLGTGRDKESSNPRGSDGSPASKASGA